jgi:hypothetical protein
LTVGGDWTAEERGVGAHCPRGLDDVSRPHAAAFIARNDAPLIAERAATRGRGATAGGDEHAGA